MKLEKYAEKIRLYEPITRPEPFQDYKLLKESLRSLIDYFCIEEGAQHLDSGKFADDDRYLRALLNIREPKKIPAEAQKKLDKFLWTERLKAGIVHVDEIKSVQQTFGSNHPHGELLSVWQGDITRLDADVIVNAGNEKLLGCFIPLHACIDNAIHSAAGPQLRMDCSVIMHIQGHDEPSGGAKITRAYHLPSKFVLHTVGPVVQKELNDRHKELLASSYQSCLGLAAEIKEIRIMAFCCISTGLYGFPAEEAAPIAVQTVSEWLDEHPERFSQIIFNVFTERDYEFYQKIFTNAGG
ncbi:protein-ADP-ribose hydrolase [bacterium]|nr:protein-ADP-ribose hydrolase [bacterium]